MVINIFFTDSRYAEQAKIQVKKGYNIIIYKKFEQAFKNILKEENIKKIGFESKNLTYYQYISYSGISNIKLIPLDNVVEKLRLKKKKQEISKIKKAIEISEKSLKNIYFNLFEKNIREIDFKLLLEQEMIKNGGEDVSFPTIVVSGARSSLIHGAPCRKKIDKSTTIIIDFGVKYSGYCSDKTVTFFNKKSCKQIKNVYNIVKDAKNFAIDSIKHGKKAKDIDMVAREYIDKKGFGKYFTHSLGHGVGIEVHEAPTLSPISEDVLEQGMVFTIEPGVYIEGEFGIRLEDMIYIGETSVEVLTEPAENFDFGDF